MMAKTLTLRLTDEQSSMLEELMRHTSTNTASKVLIHAMSTHLRLVGDLARMKLRCEEEVAKNDVLNQKIKSLEDSCRQILEIAGQKELKV